jgi:hypothetical protein
MVCLSDGMSVWWYIRLMVCLSDGTSTWWYVCLMTQRNTAFCLCRVTGTADDGCYLFHTQTGTFPHIPTAPPVTQSRPNDTSVPFPVTVQLTIMSCNVNKPTETSRFWESMYLFSQGAQYYLQLDKIPKTSTAECQHFHNCSQVHITQGACKWRTIICAHVLKHSAQLLTHNMRQGTWH